MRIDVLIAVLCLAATTHAETAAPERLQHVERSELTHTYAPGVFAPEYTPPAPGSYTLPVIASVKNHPLVDADGSPTSLFALTGDRLAVVALIYTSCVEALGCPVSHAVLHRLDRALADDPALAERVTLVTLSFDADRDTPAAMAAQRKLHEPRGDWRFVTTRGGADLAQVLQDFDQPVAK